VADRGDESRGAAFAPEEVSYLSKFTGCGFIIWREVKCARSVQGDERTDIDR
jgi:hypothetical protein